MTKPHDTSPADVPELSDPGTSLQNMTQVSDPIAPDQAVPAGGELPPVVLGSLSPSRAADFKTCPLLYRFRCIDRLPEEPSRAAVRGTLVHSVLESLFDLPSAERTVEEQAAGR